MELEERHKLFVRTYPALLVGWVVKYRPQKGGVKFADASIRNSHWLQPSTYLLG